MKQINGWHLPGKDAYFTRFIEGGPPKQNGFQREHLQAAFSHVKEWDIAIDVGAYVGFWTLDMAAKFDRVYAFEPAPDSYECLSRNMVEFPNVTMARLAVGARPGTCSLMDDPERVASGKPTNTGSRYINMDGEGTEVIALDDFDFGGCDLLKIDVEGYEAAVIDGAKHMIRAYRPVIIMETDKRFGRRFGFDKGAAQRAVLELGYREIEYRAPDKRDPRKQINAIRPDRIFVPDVL